MKDLQLTFAGRQLTDQELETLASWRTDGSGFNIISSEPNSLDYEHAHSANAQDPNSQTYFEDLISRFTSAESLPRFTDNTFGSESISLYGFDADGQPSLPKDALSGEKFALAMRVLPRMMYYNLGVQLQQEMSLMLESKTTNDTQMERVRSLLSQYAKLKRDQEIIGQDISEAERFAVDAVAKFSTGASTNGHDFAVQPGEAAHDLENSITPLSQSTSAESQADTRVQTVKIHTAKIAVSTIFNWVKGPKKGTFGPANAGKTSRPWAPRKTVEDYFRSQRQDRVARRFGMRTRFVAAVSGGLSLIVPMLIMAINPSQIKTLVTSSVAVLLFSLGLAWKSSAKTETLLATTATYAAVMVVFVGVNSN